MFRKRLLRKYKMKTAPVRLGRFFPEEIRLRNFAALGFTQTAEIRVTVLALGGLLGFTQTAEMQVTVLAQFFRQHTLSPQSK
jgi:hypothetical protein